MRTRSRRVVAVALGAVLALTVFATPALATVRVTTNLVASDEVPPTGSPATGSFSARVVPYKGKVCYTLSWQNLSSTPTAAHIHHAGPGVNGPIIVPLSVTGNQTDTVTTCATGLQFDPLRQLARHPTEYYVNVHSQNFPGGEIRGQLAKV